MKQKTKTTVKQFSAGMSTKEVDEIIGQIQQQSQENMKELDALKRRNAMLTSKIDKMLEPLGITFSDLNFAKISNLMQPVNPERFNEEKFQRLVNEEIKKAATEARQARGKRRGNVKSAVTHSRIKL